MFHQMYQMYGDIQKNVILYHTEAPYSSTYSSVIWSRRDCVYETLNATWFPYECIVIFLNVS